MSRLTAIVIASALVLAPAVYAQRVLADSPQAAPQTTYERNRAEIAETVRLNQEIVARNNAAAQREAADRARFEREDARWREETARLAAERSQWERDKAAWEAQIAECRRTGRPCVTNAPQD